MSKDKPMAYARQRRSLRLHSDQFASETVVLGNVRTRGNARRVHRVAPPKVCARSAAACDDGCMADAGDEVTKRDELLGTDERPTFAPQVGPPVARGVRPIFVIALVAAVALPALWVWRIGVRPTIVISGAASEPRSALPAGCTPLEVEETIRSAAMTDIDRVTCLAVAGKIDRARAMLRAMPARTQTAAISRVFAVAHPIADRGDDASAGPIMWLVVEFWPQNYMAVFHAGMADFALGRDDAARTQLENFLQMYAQQDVWRARAERALAAIGAHAPLDQREAHFPE